MSVEKFLKAINYKINDGYDYQWNCFGDNAHSIESIDEDNYECECIFDTKTQNVYQLSMVDYVLNIGYTWLNPEFKEYYFNESVKRNVNPFEATEEIKYHECELMTDILEKMTLLVNGEEYDKGILIPLDLPDDLYNDLMLLASDRNVTIDKLISDALEESFKKYEADTNGGC
jgi:hypothetical protein